MTLIDLIVLGLVIFALQLPALYLLHREQRKNR
jgi:hypothetical protein